MNELSSVYPWTHEKALPYKDVCLVPFRVPDEELEGLEKIGLRPSTVAMFTKGHWNGYTALHKSLIPREWRDGSYDHPGMQALNIHGGLTYCRATTNYVIYGFDCGHAGDDEKPELYDPDYVAGLARQMRQQLLAFAQEWKRYKRLKLRARTEVIDRIRARGKIRTDWSFAVNLGVLAGELPL